MALAFAVGAGIPAVATAATSQDKNAARLEEVIVTAQRREQSLQTTPIAMTAFNTRQLTEIGVHSIADIDGFAPNINIEKTPNTNTGMDVFIRGIGTSETALTADPKIGIYIDDVYVSKTMGAIFDIVDMKQMQILRGPQGTLFGRNTTGGAILVTTEKPKGEFAVKAKASLGNFDYQRYGASVDLPSVANIATKLSFYRMRTNGWAKNYYNGPPIPPADNIGKNLGSENNRAWRIALEWKPTDSLTVDYTFDRTNDFGVPQPFQVTKVKDSIYNGFTDSPTPFTYLGGQMYQQMAALVGNPHDRHKTFFLDSQSKEWLDVTGQSLHLAWDMNGTVFKYIFGYRKTSTGYHGADYGGAYTAPDLFYGGGAVVPVPEFAAAINSNIKMTTHELQVIGNAFDEKLKYTSGLFYYHEDNSQGQPETFSIPIEFLLASAPSLRSAYAAAGFCNTGVCIGTQRLPLPFPSAGADPNLNGLQDVFYGQDTRSWAAYTQISYDITDSLELLAGVRYTNETRKAFLFNEGLGQLSVADKLQADHQWDNWSGMADLNYQINQDVMVYGKVTTGFNGGLYNARAATVDSFVKPAKPETVTALELGVKSEWFDHRLRLNAAVFRNDYSDIQIAQFEAGTGGASSRIVNAGQGTYQGFELDLTAMPVEGLTINLNYGWLDAKFNDYVEVDPVTNQKVDISGRTTVPYAPDNTASLRVKYEFPLTAIGRLSAMASANYKDKYVFHPFQNQFDSTRARTLIDGRITLSDIPLGSDVGQLEVALWGKNLTDKEYRVFGIDFGALGFTGDTFGEPRTYGLDVVYRYN